jgi:spermidine synthase
MSRATVLGFYVLFAASGFAALIYESVWSHYLKLFLGHAAYAQALVLALFMGGMALGAWWCGARSPRWRNLLLGYAAAEAAVGVGGLVFHRLFVGVTGFAHDTVIPGLASPLAVDAFKWGLGALMILPQSVLLGMTFPLMAGGLLRRMAGREGETVAGLYFTNSLGAAAGVLASGFVLIGLAGLPGTLLTASLVNLALAAAVYLYARRPDAQPAAAPQPAAAGALDGYARWMLAASFVTGAASFMYEIGWIRMLTMVLGAATHAFELMLSAFILGLAFGGLWIKRRIDAFAVPERALGVIQIAMGLLALATLLVYGTTFQAMKLLLESVAPTDGGYAVFNAGSHLIAMAVMLPATFCAGMTLPLLTLALMRRGGERAIGAVYAANTVGAIVGVFVAIHFAMPVLGLKGLIALGAALDIGLGIALLWRFPAGAALRRFAGALGIAALAGALAWVELDQVAMASSVFRGQPLGGKETSIPFHRDGKTATVHLIREGDLLSVTTNGKSDGSLDLRPGAPVYADEPVMTLSGALPLLLHPGARSAAVIGIGTGLSSHALLASESLASVETVEIEPAMVEAARAFRPHNERVFADPRSRIRIEDAKTFFASHRRRFDIIVSEPSNPWVSGVASLFSEEFYARVKRHLEKDGLFVQWLQLYELEPRLAASVVKALGRQFSHYDIFAADDFNLLIVARDGGPVPPVAAAAFAAPRLAGDLARLQVRSPADVDVFHLGSRPLLEPYFAQFAVPSNSDFFPVLDQEAVKARFLGRNASEITALALAPLPALEMLGGAPRRRPISGLHPWLKRSGQIHAAQRGLAYLSHREASPVALPAQARRDFELVKVALADCRLLGNNFPFEPAYAVATLLLPHVGRGDTADVWKRLQAASCRKDGARLARWLELFAAIDRRDAPGMAATAGALLDGGETRHVDYLLGAAILGRLARGETEAARALWQRYAGLARSEGASALPALLRGHLFYRPQERSAAIPPGGRT